MKYSNKFGKLHIEIEVLELNAYYNEINVLIVF